MRHEWVLTSRRMNTCYTLSTLTEMLVLSVRQAQTSCCCCQRMRSRSLVSAWQAKTSCRDGWCRCGNRRTHRSFELCFTRVWCQCTKREFLVRPAVDLQMSGVSVPGVRDKAKLADEELVRDHMVLDGMPVQFRKVACAAEPAQRRMLKEVAVMTLTDLG